MPRRPRQRSRTDCYHVIVRGLNKLAVFKDKREKIRILNLIRENFKEYNVKIYAYCIMSNHFHLLLQAELKDLSAFMAKVLASYAQYYNYRHKRIGYVFQDRFRSQCVEEESYFWNCVRYIHLNPVKAGICRDMEEYKCSSISEYYQVQDEEDRILWEGVLRISRKRFGNKRTFIDFHNMKDRDFFIEVPEEEFMQRVEIAKGILWDMEYELKTPAEEIIDYSKTRNEFEQRLADTFHISKKAAQEIRKKLGQGK